ncbi:hypothetical protein HKX48_008032 [Thoreauomyces humboldtii]|nr:hypothetical protein HKX48_008032 [Thoreauomyces humboldtii]
MAPPSKHPKKSVSKRGGSGGGGGGGGPESEPTTAPAAVDEALLLEDKGDRYATGDKAVRFYLRARDMWAHAHSLDPADMDTVYNWGRLLLLLAEFTDPAFEPAERCGLFREAAERLRGGDARNADCLFNLAQALRGFAEVVLEEEGDAGEAVAALTEAEAALGEVFVLRSASNDDVGASMAMDVSDGQQSQPNEDETDTEPRATALVDTLTAHAQTLTMLFKEVADPEASVLYQRALDRLRTAEGILATDANPQQTNEVHIRYAEVLAARADVVAQVQGRVDVEAFEGAVGYLDRVLAADPNNVEALCEKGDVLTSWADAVRSVNGGTQAVLAHLEATPSPLATLRTLHVRAVDAYTTAYALTPTNGTLSRTLGNAHLARIPLHPAPTESLVLAANAEKYYRRSVALGDQGMLIPLAKAIGWQGKEEECRKVVEAWRKKMARGDEDCHGEDDETLEVGFGPVVETWTWFEKAFGA